MILLRSFLSGHIRIKRTLEYYDAGIGPRVPFGGGFGPTVSANFAVALGDFTTLSSTSTMPTGGSISRAGNAYYFDNTGTLQTAATNVARFDNSWNGSAWVAKGLLVEGARTNVFLNSASPATQAITVTAQSYTLSFYGTGTITLSGASTAGPLVGTGANNRVTLTFTPSAGSLTLTLSGAITYPQLEAGSFASSYIVSGGSATTRNAETFALTGYANRLVEAFYIDEETGANYSGNSALSTGTVTISPPTFGWVTSLRAYQNAYAGSISTPSWLSFSGTTGTTAGNRTYYDSTGTLTYAPANLLQQSQALATSPWTTFNAGTGLAPVRTNDYGAAPDNTVTATRVQLSLGGGTTTADRSVVNQPGITVQTGVNFIYSVYVRSLSGSVSFSFQTDGLSPAVITRTATESWQRFVIVGSSTTSSVTIGVQLRGGQSPAHSNSADLLVWGAQLEPVTYQTAPSAYIPTTSAAVYGPRYDYDPSTVPATPRGLLIEEQRANIAPSVGNYTRTNCSFTGTTTTAPDGTSITPLTVTTTAVTNSYAVVTATANTMTYSIYAKKGSAATDANRFGIYNNTTSSNVLFFGFNYDTGAITYTTGSSGASAVNVGNGWWRISITPASGITSGNTIIIYQGFSGGSETAGEYAYVWGAQLEAGSFATSYIPTTTASVTRAADVAQLTGSALTTAGAATGSAIVQTTLWQNSTAAARDLLSSATTRRLLYSNSSNTVLSSTDGTTGLNATIGGSGTFTGGAVRSAVAWNASGRSLIANNGTLTSDAVNLSTGATATLGGYGTTTTFDGWIASMALYNQQLPNAILAQKSTVGAPY